MAADVGTLIRSRRPPKDSPDPWVPIGVVCEPERSGPESFDSTVTVFLAGSECPFTCVFCDLWRHTLDGPTPKGAIPAQLDLALSGLDQPPVGGTLKLYNASNFFDSRAVPSEDWQAIADLAEPFDRVTVECHPRMIDDRVWDFDGLLRGRLEVALGLETVHPEALRRLNKGMTIGDFDRAADLVVDWGLDLRVFVLVGAPWIPQREMVASVVQTVEHAFARGARVASLIAVRDGNGTLETLEACGGFSRPSLAMFEEAVERSNELGRGIVLADLWDVSRLQGPGCCFGQRIERLRRINSTGVPGQAVACIECGRS